MYIINDALEGFRKVVGMFHIHMGRSDAPLVVQVTTL